MSNLPALPDYIKNNAGSSSSDVDSMASASSSVPRMSLRGRTFRFIENGEETFKTTNPVDVIILGVEPEAGRFIKTYYEKGYTPNSNEPPTCASDDGIRPAIWVTKKQANDCMSCSKNVFGSATSPNGKPTKACRDAKRLWLVRAEDPNGADGTIYGLNASVSSLKALSEYGRKLKANNVPLSLAITRLTMADAEYPQLEFECVGFVKEEQVQVNLKKSEERPWKLNISAGLALAGSESQSTPTAALPIAVPEHVKTTASNVDVDDMVSKW